MRRYGSVFCNQCSKGWEAESLPMWSVTWFGIASVWCSRFFSRTFVHHSPYVVFVNCPVCLGQLQPNTVIPWRFILAPLLTAMCNPPVRWAVPTDLSKSLVKASDLLRPCTRYIHHLRLLVLISVSGMSLKPTLYLSLSVACSRPRAAHIGYV